MLRIYDIKWIPDDEDALYDLPTEILVDENFFSDFNDDDEISDWLSDYYGFLHEGFELEPLFVLETTSKFFSEVVWQMHDTLSEKDLNLALKNMVNTLQPLYNRLSEKTGGNEEVYILGDAINLLSSLRIVTKESNDDDNNDKNEERSHRVVGLKKS